MNKQHLDHDNLVVLENCFFYYVVNCYNICLHRQHGFNVVVVVDLQSLLILMTKSCWKKNQ